MNAKPIERPRQRRRGMDLSGSLQGAGGVGGLLAVQVGQSAPGELANTLHFACNDGNGNVCALVNAADGTESARYDYGPFGEVLRATGPMAEVNPICFSTQYADDVTGDVKYLYRDYTPRMGRWLSRDPIWEKGGVNLYGFVANAPINAIDLLGRIAKGGEMQMNCRQPCEDFKRQRYADMEPGDIPSGLVVCCGGVKFICTYGAEKEANQRAREIAKRCITAHERVHLPSVSCSDCPIGPKAVKWNKSGKAACEEEVAAYGIGKACFEAALSECGDDQQCVDSVNRWIAHESKQEENYRAMCKWYER